MLKKLSVYSILCLFLSACQTYFPVAEEISEKKPSCGDGVESIELTDIDYLLFANKMIDSMIQAKNIQQQTARKRMTLSIKPVQNNTDEAIEMKTINLAIKNRVLRSSRFIITESATEQFQLSGSFEKIERSSTGCTDAYTQFSLQLMNMQTNRILWSEDKKFN